MSDIARIVKYLDITPARVPSLAEASIALKPYDKYYRLQKSRPIIKIPIVFTLPAFSIPVEFPNQFQKGELIFQYNMTVGHDFVIKTPFVFNGNLGGVLCVKYREGVTVRRYAIYGNQEHLALTTDILAFPQYTNQVIRSNCCFEFWVTYLHPETSSYGLPNNFKISTLLLVNPAFVEEIERLLINPGVLTKNDIGVALPETLPYNQELQVWLDNEGVSFLSSSNGFDPILGAPYPPINYQLIVSSNPTKLTWNVPELILNIFQNISPPSFPPILSPWQDTFIKSYHQDPTTASQTGNIVTLAGGAFVFIDTATNVGEQIIWQNTGEVSTIVTVTSPTTAIVDTNFNIAAGSFQVIPPNTVFKLYWWKPSISQFVVVADSEGGIYPNILGILFTLRTLSWRFYPPIPPPIPANLYKVPAYVSAIANGKTITSQEFETWAYQEAY